MITSPSSSLPFPQLTFAAPVAPPLNRNTGTHNFDLLVALVVSSIIGIGMLMPAPVYQMLALHKPEPDNGVYAHAKASSVKYVGSNSAWGHRVSAWTGNFGYLKAGGDTP